MKMVIAMGDKIKVDVTDSYRKLMENPREIENMDATTLKAIASLIREQEKLDSTKNTSSGIEKGNSLKFTHPSYRGEETRSDNVFNRRIDGYAGPLILSTITLLFGVIFMLIIFNY